MDNKKKEQIGIMLNLVQLPSLGTELRSYCEAELIFFLKKLNTPEEVIGECMPTERCGGIDPSQE